LIWPLVLAIGILLAPLVVLVALVLWPFGRGRRLLLAGPLLFRVFCALRGLSVEVRSAGHEVRVRFW
jgi:hypothetical protein